MWAENHAHVINFKNKCIRFALLGLLAVAVAVAVLIFAQPKADAGNLIFVRFNEEKNGDPLAVLFYRPPQTLNRKYFELRFRYVDALAGTELPSEHIAYIRPQENCVLRGPTNSIWRIQGVVFAESRGIPAWFGKLKNVLHAKRLSAWRDPSFHPIGPLISLPITNPVPSTPARSINKSSLLLFP
jgi:hypothetical protein